VKPSIIWWLAQNTIPLVDVERMMKSHRSALAVVLAALVTAARAENPGEPLWTFETGG
jgi:hypothetical protein